MGRRRSGSGTARTPRRTLFSSEYSTRRVRAQSPVCVVWEGLRWAE